MKKTNLAGARRDAADARITSHASRVVRAAMEVVAEAKRISPGVYEIAPVLMLRLREAVDELERQSRYAGRLYITKIPE